MTQKFWWMALPALVLLGARSAGQTPTACPAACAAKAAAAKSNCAGCAASHANKSCCHGECPKAKVAELIGQFKTLYKTGKYQEAEQVARKVCELDPDNVTAAAAMHVAHIAACCADNAACCADADCACASGKCCDGGSACCKDGSCQKQRTGSVTIGIGVSSTKGVIGSLVVNKASCQCCGSCQCADCAKCQKAKGSAAKSDKCDKHQPQCVTGQFVPAPPVALCHPPLPPVAVYQPAPPVVMPFPGAMPVPPPVMPLIPPAPPAAPHGPFDYFIATAPAPAQPYTTPARTYVVTATLVSAQPEYRNCQSIQFTAGEKDRGRAQIVTRPAGEPAKNLDLSAKVREVKSGKVRLQMTVGESERYQSKKKGTMVVSECCRIRRTVKLGERTKIPLDSTADGADCECWLEVTVRPLAAFPTSGMTTTGKRYDRIIPPAPVAVPPLPAPEPLPAPKPTMAPCPVPTVAREVVQCVAAEVVKAPAKAARFRVVKDDGCSRLEIGDTGMTCEGIIMKMSRGGSVEVGAGCTQVVVRGKSFCAYADRVTCDQKDRLILEGNARLCHEGGGHANCVMGDKLMVRINDGMSVTVTHGQ